MLAVMVKVSTLYRVVQQKSGITFIQSCLKIRIASHMKLYNTQHLRILFDSISQKFQKTTDGLKNKCLNIQYCLVINAKYLHLGSTRSQLPDKQASNAFYLRKMHNHILPLVF